jgi:hypothetical protein
MLHFTKQHWLTLGSVRYCKRVHRLLVTLPAQPAVLDAPRQLSPQRLALADAAPVSESPAEHAATEVEDALDHLTSYYAELNAVAQPAAAEPCIELTTAVLPRNVSLPTLAPLQPLQHITERNH